MAITSHPGSWFGLPDYGITEAIGKVLGSSTTSQGGSNIIGGSKAAGNVLGSQSMYPSQSFSQIQNYTPSTTKSVNSTGSTGTQQNTGGQFDFTSGLKSPSDPFGGGGSQIDAINQQFNDFNNYLNTQETQANQNFTDTKALYDTQKTNAQNQYNTEKTQQTQDIKSNEALNLKKVRQLLSDLGQGNAARIAIGGGGSISEVLGERFNREAQSRVGNVMDQSQKAITRVNDFYNNAITKLQESYDANILQARQALQDNLSQISNARMQSAQAKQQSTMDAWRSYYDNVNQAKIQAATFKSQYDLWKTQQDNQLAATNGFNLQNADWLNSGVQNSFSNTPQAPGVQTTQDQYNMNPTYRLPNKNTQDEYQKYLASLGVTPAQTPVVSNGIG